MENENLAGLIVAIAALISPVLTWLGDYIQKKREEKREPIEDVVQLSTAMRNVSESWTEIIDRLEKEVARCKGIEELKDKELAQVRRDLEASQRNVERLIGGIGMLIRQLEELEQKPSWTP